MRTLALAELREAVMRLTLEAEADLPADVQLALETALASESSEPGREALSMILENAELARAGRIPLCQDTGMLNVFLELGPGVCLEGHPASAVDDGIAAATLAGGLRASLVADPLVERVNTGDNRPAFLYLETGGRKGEAHLTVMPKGGGSENASALVMLLPTASPETIVAEITRQVGAKAPFACPPVVVGVGIGGNADMAMKLSKRALLREVGQPHPRREYRKMEEAVLREVNLSGIGPAGLGGDITALAVAIEEAPTHIACLPLAVSISCHALRRRSASL